jgi:glyoxylase-like metal-dependent hydrolase (beta-lactamase superfamily II)
MTYDEVRKAVNGKLRESGHLWTSAVWNWNCVHKRPRGSARNATVKLLKERGEQTRLTTLKLSGGPSSPAYSGYASMRFLPPDHVFPIQDGLKLSFGGEDVRVFYPGPSQAPDKLVVYFPARRLLFGSCMILAGSKPGNIAEADMKQWPESVRKLEQFPVDVVVPGHGERLDPALIQHTIDLLTNYERAEQNGPANGSQPIRSETNTTSSAAGSRR